MDLGIAGRRAIVCASSKGLGRGCAEALAREGVDVVINGRHEAEVMATADAIRQNSRVNVTPVVADVTTPEGRDALLKACPEPDILINNAGGPPPGDFRDLDEDQWLKGLVPNLVAPIMLIKATVDGMAKRKFGRVINVTSRSVKTPLYHLPLSNAARAGLTGMVAGLARQVAKDNVIINNLLPGPFATERQMGPMRGRAEQAGIDYETFVKQQTDQVPTRRFGTAEEFGNTCAYLCSVHASFIVGQNLLMDGGGFASTV
ncbi:3-oxoacyl-ACP reductase [Pseudolabrys sp. Root1462]|uniref:SDR family oxidoreductase n=1 Tax=Pseudolabrys sp. Root1462 TaxID=1736466 RepID=UPI000702DBCC|nr:SDR family oxidoreductase [Pseudolabrys sp. Root1462]KQZ00855.1 3-oxoacyl-ACP reductase [Pseudolabrys sp. Root1462]